MPRDIATEVRRVIHEQLDVDDATIKAESSFIDDLGADSLAIVELVLKLEETFQITIPEDETEKIRTVQDAIAYIQQHAAA
jgi:acyl carrier protein